MAQNPNAVGGAAPPKQPSLASEIGVAAGTGGVSLLGKAAAAITGDKKLDFGNTLAHGRDTLWGDIGKELGLDGAQGEYYQPGEAPELEKIADFQSALGDEMGNRASAAGSSQLAEAMQRYSQSGDMSGIQSLMGSMTKAGQGSAIQDALATGATTGSRYATEQVQNNPLLAQLFGKGGALERAGTEEQGLAKRGYSLQPEDYEAYGQASGDIARTFGQQEQSLAQSLADRGLASAPSGAAAVGFSGLQGNKFEQLAKSQRDIADRRMQNNTQRLQQTRSYLSQLGGQGASAIQDQFGRQMSGAAFGEGQRQNTLKGQQDAYGLNSANTNERNRMALSKYSTQEQQKLASMQDKRGAKGVTLGEMFGRGIGKGAEALPTIALEAGASTVTQGAYKPVGVKSGPMSG